jgi:hypothetical protein
MKYFYLIFWDNLDSVLERNRFLAKDIFYPICKEGILLIKEGGQSIAEELGLHLFSEFTYQSRINLQNI